MEVINNEEMMVIKLEIEIEKTGHITNTYIVFDKKSNMCMVIDPAFDSDRIKEEIKKINGELEYVVITHAHADHIAALANLVNGTNTHVYIHEYDYNGLFDKEINKEEVVETKVDPVDKTNIITLKDGDTINLGEISFEIMNTPGHTKGSMIIFNGKFNFIFSGDTIFENTYGRTDLTTGSHDDMEKSLDRIFNSFKNPLVFSGHGNSFFLEDSKRRIKLLFAYKG